VRHEAPDGDPGNQMNFDKYRLLKFALDGYKTLIQMTNDMY
jgi:hypothetical protein